MSVSDPESVISEGSPWRRVARGCLIAFALLAMLHILLCVFPIVGYVTTERTSLTSQTEHVGGGIGFRVTGNASLAERSTFPGVLYVSTLTFDAPWRLTARLYIGNSFDASEVQLYDVTVEDSGGSVLAKTTSPYFSLTRDSRFVLDRQDLAGSSHMIRFESLKPIEETASLPITVTIRGSYLMDGKRHEFACDISVTKRTTQRSGFATE